jgi:hypothetical protein
VINASQLLSHSFPEFLKLAKIVMVHALEYVEDECCFSSVSFFKTELRNCLNPHLQSTLAMYAHKFFTPHNFPSQVVHIIHGQTFSLQMGSVDMLELQVLGFAVSHMLVTTWQFGKA